MASQTLGAVKYALQYHHELLASFDDFLVDFEHDARELPSLLGQQLLQRVKEQEIIKKFLGLLLVAPRRKQFLGLIIVQEYS